MTTIRFHPTGALRSATATVQSYYRLLRGAGDSRDWPGAILGLAGLNDLVGLGELQREEAAVL